MFAHVRTVHADPDHLAKAFTRLYIATRDERHAEAASRWREFVPAKGWAERVQNTHHSPGIASRRQAYFQGIIDPIWPGIPREYVALTFVPERSTSKV